MARPCYKVMVKHDIKWIPDNQRSIIQHLVPAIMDMLVSSPAVRNKFNHYYSPLPG